MHQQQQDRVHDDMPLANAGPELEGKGRTEPLRGKSLPEQLEATRPTSIEGKASEVEQISAALEGPSQGLPDRASHEAHFGRSLENVRVHTDVRAQDAARFAGANAVAVGNDILSSRPALDASTARHEIAHTLQQTAPTPGAGYTSSVSTLEKQAEAAASGAAPALSAGPAAVMKDTTTLLDAAQIDRAVAYNRSRPYASDVWVAVQAKIGTTPDGQVGRATVLAIAQWQQDGGLKVDGMVGPSSLQAMDVVPAGPSKVEQEEETAAETGDREQTFSDEKIAEMKGYFVDNAAREKPAPCIVTMNKGLKNLYGDKSLKTSSTVQDTMALMEKGGMVSEKREIEFLDSNGGKTTGVREPVTPSENPSGYIIGKCAEPGWHVFGMSLMDGYHSITITVDARDPGDMKMYWSDQWRSNGGFAEVSASELNDRITRFTRDWWNGYKKEKGHPPRSRLTFWKLQGQA